MAAISLCQDRFYANMAWWQSEPDIHIIHIVRTDNLAWLRSKFVARKLSSFGAGNQYSDDVSVSIPVYRALKRLQMKLWLDQTIGELATSNPYHVIRYEDLFIDRNSVIQKAQQFLGFEPELMPEEMIRQRQSKGIPIEKHIRNFRQLEEALERASLLTAPIPGIV